MGPNYNNNNNERKDRSHDLPAKRRQRSPAHGTDRPHHDPLFEAFGVHKVRTRRDRERHTDLILFTGRLLLFGREDVHAREADRTIRFRPFSFFFAVRFEIASVLQVGEERRWERSRVVIPRGESRQVEPLCNLLRDKEARAARSDGGQAHQESASLVLW